VTLLSHVLAGETMSVCAAAVVQKPRRKRRRKQMKSKQSADTSDVSSHQTSATVTVP